MDTTTLLMIALFVALGYFMLVRPARQQQKKQAALMSELETGSRVMTQIGVYGTLVELGDVQARIEVSPGVVLTVDKRLISGVTPRSRDEFWTYPDESAAEGDQPLVDGPVDQVGEDDAVVDRDSAVERDSTVEGDAVIENDVYQDREPGVERDARTDGPDDRKA